MNELKIFNYNNNSISFKVGETTMINATQMAKPFGKRPIDYLKLPSTQELMAAIERRISNMGKSRNCDNQEVTAFTEASDRSIVRKSHNCDNQAVTKSDIMPNIKSRVICTVRGSSENGGGTWMHEDLALDFAQWLSIDFKLWCNDRIKELLLNGKVENNTFKSQRYVAGRNIMPGMHLPQLMSIGSQPVMTIHYSGNTYYKVKDIMKACDVWVTYKRKDISEPPFKKHIYWFSDSISNTGTPKRYFPIDGVMKLFSSIRRPTKQASQFMRAFAEHLHPTPTLIAQSGPYIDADRLLEVIVNTTKEEDRKFLYNIYRLVKQ